ncbi:sulfotransferase family protein [Rhodovibrionaceae bacterium A322]
MTRSDELPPSRLDFVIIGAQKAGSSFLSRVLDSHPALFIPEAEVRSFRDPFYPDFRPLQQETSKARPGQLIGIKHPSYLGRAEVPERLYRYNPDLRLLAVLRDPVDRALSSYLHFLRQGQISPLHPEQGLRLVLNQPTLEPKYQEILNYGRYHQFLSVFLERFPAEQIHLMEFESFGSSRATVDSAFAHLGVTAPENLDLKIRNEGRYTWEACLLSWVESKSRFCFDGSMNIVGHEPEENRVKGLGKLNSKLNQEPRISLSQGLREALGQYYAPDVSRLADLGFVPDNWPNFPKS